MRYELSTHEWSFIRPMLPNKPRGVPRVDDRHPRSGAPWRDLPESFGPHTTCYNRFVRWRRAGVWDRIMDVLAHRSERSGADDRHLGRARTPARSLHRGQSRAAHRAFTRRADQQDPRSRRCSIVTWPKTCRSVAGSVPLLSGRQQKREKRGPVGSQFLDLYSLNCPGRTRPSTPSERACR